MMKLTPIEILGKKLLKATVQPNEKDIEWAKSKMPKTARCRWCDRNDVPIGDMAVMSWKKSYGGYTGVCTTCFNSKEAEKDYILKDEKKTE